MGLFSNKESYLGVDIGANGIKLVELHTTKGRPQLWTYAMADSPLDIHIKSSPSKSPKELIDESKHRLTPSKKEMPQGLDDPRIAKYAKILKGLLKEARVTTKKTTASLPVSYVFHAVLTLPEADDKELGRMVTAEVEKMLPRPIDEMQVVHQKIPQSKSDKEKKYIHVLVTAAPKDLVRFYTAIFQRAGLELQELETEAFAIERSLVGRDSATSMVVDIGAERTNFFIIDSSLPLVHRSINIGGNTFDKIIEQTLDIENSLVLQIKKDVSRIKNKLNPEIFMPALEPIIKEIEYGFDLFLSQIGNEGKKPEKIILTGGSAVLPFIADEIKKNFDMKVFVGDPWARVVYQEGLKPVLDDIGPRMSVSIGLALRNIIKD